MSSSTRKAPRLLDVLGPIMIGPSSSHTAGACRLALLARAIYDRPYTKVLCELHGSFAHTYTGHGSDRAIAGGLLGLAPDDARLRDALELATEAGLDIRFEPADLGQVHPNTIRFTFEDSAEPFTVTGSSLGGAAVLIIEVNDTEVAFTGDKPTLLLRYEDRFGMIGEVTDIIRRHQLNIAALRVTREENIATMVLELDEAFDATITEELENLFGVLFFKALA